MQSENWFNYGEGWIQGIVFSPDGNPLPAGSYV